MRKYIYGAALVFSILGITTAQASLSPPDQPGALVAQTWQRNQVPSFLSETQKLTQTQAPTAAPTTVVPTNATGTTVSTTGNVDSNTKISVGSLAGDIFYVVASVFTAVFGSALTALVARLFSGVGINLTAQRKEQLQALVERGVIWAASRTKTALDGKIPIDVKSQVVADAIRYVESQGAGLIKSLGDKPGTPTATAALEARVETVLASPAVPVAVVPASPTSERDSLIDKLSKDLAQAQAQLSGTETNAPTV